MDTGGRLNDGFVGGVVEGEEGISKWTSRVDYALVKNPQQDGPVKILIRGNTPWL